jgi:hypothetical protein
MPRLKSAMVVALAALFAPALFAVDTQNLTPANSAAPGTLNYIEGTAQINGQFLNQQDVGSVSLEPGQEITTSTGRAELLLTPGVFFRLGDNSTAKMVSPDLTNTVVDLEHGRASVEVDQLFKANDIHVLVNQVPVQLVKPGLYEFNAHLDRVMVFKGEAAALRPNEKFVAIKEGHELNVSNAASLKSAKFDETAQEQTPLYRWSNLRSDYLAEANQQIAGEYGEGYAAGWYWDPWMLDYTFLGPYPFYSPFGWGFYPMGWGWGGFYGGGFYGGGGRYIGPHGPVNLPKAGFGGSAAHSGLRGNAFHPGGSLGGFHGGFGGFHGGGGHGR